MTPIDFSARAREFNGTYGTHGINGGRRPEQALQQIPAWAVHTGVVAALICETDGILPSTRCGVTHPP
jgi:hypothetical protein